MPDRIVAEPDRLLAYAEAARRACDRVAADSYGHALRRYRDSQPNDLLCVALDDLSDRIEATRESMRHLADQAEAFAWALWQLDRPAGPGDRRRASVSVSGSLDALLALLVELRLDMPDATDGQVLQAAGARRARQLRDAIAVEDQDAIAALLEPVGRYGADPAFARGFVAGLGADGIDHVLEALGRARDVRSARHVADAFFVGVAAMASDEATTVLLRLSDATLGVLGVAGTVVPSPVVARRFVGLGALPFMYAVSNAKLRLLERLVPADDPAPTLDAHVRTKVFEDMLDHTGGFVVITEAVGGGRHSPELGNALIDHLEARPQVLDSLAHAAGTGGRGTAAAVHQVMAALAAGDDATGLYGAYAAYRVRKAMVPGDLGDTSHNLLRAGEAIGRLRNGLAAANATLHVHVVGMLIDTGAVGAAYFPPTAPIVELHDRVSEAAGIVTDNVGTGDVTTLDDVIAGVEENRRDFVGAVDLLTARRGDRRRMVEALGLTLTQDDVVVAEDLGSLQWHDLQTDDPDVSDLAVMADALADGIGGAE